MSSIRKVFHLREIIVALVVAITMIVLGGIFDLKLTKAIYDPVNTNMFGVILSGICELPVCVGLAFGGFALIKARPTDKTWKQVLSIIFGSIGVLVGAYFLFDTAKDWATFNNTAGFSTWAKVIGASLAVIIPGLIALVVFKFMKNVDNRTLFIMGICFLALAAMIAILSNVEKFLWSRPRPRYIIGALHDESLFHPLWQLDPFKCLTAKDIGDTDNLKSFPSGHTTYASTAMFILPLFTLLTPNNKENRMLQICLFYVGLAYAIMSAMSRVFAGAHYLSDTGAGMLTTIIGAVLVYIILKAIINKIENKGVKQNVNA